MRTTLTAFILLIGLCLPLQAEEGMLVFKTTPKDVEIYLDGAFKGKANELLMLDVSEGEHTIKIVKGDKSKEKQYFVPSGGLVKVSLALENKDEGKKKGKLTFNFVTLKAGSFQMGSEDGSSNEKPVHRVKISKAFKLLDHEVTVGEYRQFIESTGYEAPTKKGYKNSSKKDSHCNWNEPNVEDHPVNCVSWEDAQFFISWLNLEAGKPLYRLPTEAEWEYAARAGTKTRWACGDGEWCVTQMAWFSNNANGKTHPVKTKKPNYWGLYDMHGNVWEWVQDRWHSDYDNAPDNGSAWETIGGSGRMLRGGAWTRPVGDLRSAHRNVSSPDYRGSDYGFRLALGQD